MTTILDIFNIKNILVALSLFFAPIQTIVAVVFAFIIFDYIIALAVCLKLGVKVTSRKMAATISKIISYNIVIITCHIVGLVFLPSVPIINIVGFAIAMIELKSIDEHFQAGFGFSFYKLIKKYLDRDENIQKTNLDK